MSHFLTKRLSSILITDRYCFIQLCFLFITNFFQLMNFTQLINRYLRRNNKPKLIHINNSESSSIILLVNMLPPAQNIHPSFAFIGRSICVHFANNLRRNAKRLRRFCEAAPKKRRKNGQNLRN